MDSLFVAKNIYVTIPQDDNVIENASIITDTVMQVNKESKNYIFKFTNGDKTLQYFKKVYSDDRYEIVIFFVENFELFYSVFSLFRYCNFLYVDIPKKNEKNNRLMKYLRFEKELKLKNDLKYDSKSAKRGYMMSYYPDIYKSITSSIKNPELYLYYDSCPESLIYNELEKAPKTIEELEKLDIKDLEKRVKSLLFVGAIALKGNKLHLSEY